jgi:hypothetical protein
MRDEVLSLSEKYEGLSKEFQVIPRLQKRITELMSKL